MDIPPKRRRECLIRVSIKSGELQALNIRPIIHNVIAFHLTGQEVYAVQSRQNLNAIMQKLADQGWRSLYGLLTFMIEDLKNGPAVLE